MCFSSCESVLFLRNLLLTTWLPKSWLWISRALCFLFMLNMSWASSMYLIFPLVPMATLYCVASSRCCCTRFPLEAWLLWHWPSHCYLLLSAVLLVQKEAPFTVSTNQQLNVLQNEVCLFCHVYWIREVKNSATSDLSVFNDNFCW